MKKRYLFIAAFAGMLVAAQAALAQALAYPQQPVRWIVPYAAGGAIDAMARTLAEAMQPGMGQPMFVDNRPGAATNIAVASLLQAKPDGYTVMTAENATLSFNEHMFSKLPYKPEKDFSYIAAIGRVPVVLVVSPALPVRTLDEFLAYMKANPDKATYASPGIGTSHHMAMEMFMQRANFKMTHAVYRGGALAVQDVVAGHVPAMMIELTVGQQFIRGGKLRPIAATSSKRIPGFADVPTFTELGMPEVTAYTMHGLIAPAGLPDAVATQLNADLQKATRAPRFTVLMADTGFEPLNLTPVEFKALSRAESARWGKLIQSVGVKLD
jgi:tripartite-type tricarboxylate transporter receptor subunit TctC